ncbi:MAG: hypothetical protein Q4D62_00450 [Planctomycetia bacterium]|nr:hypothetical protein [Planctomycetia bacterium]
MSQHWAEPKNFISTKPVERWSPEMLICGGGGDLYKLEKGGFYINSLTAADGTFLFTGGTLSVGRFTGNLTNDGGIVSVQTLNTLTNQSKKTDIVASELGNLDIYDGNYTQNGGALVLDVQADGSSDQLRVSSTSTISLNSGKVILNYQGTDAPTVGTTWKLFTNTTDESRSVFRRSSEWVMNGSDASAWGFNNQTGELTYLGAMTETRWQGNEANWSVANGWSAGSPDSEARLHGIVSSGTVTNDAIRNVCDSNLTIDGGTLSLTKEKHLWFYNSQNLQTMVHLKSGSIETNNTWLGSPYMTDVTEFTAGIHFLMTGGTFRSLNTDGANGGLSLRNGDVATISGGVMDVNRIHVGVSGYSTLNIQDGASVKIKLLDTGYNDSQLQSASYVNMEGGVLRVGQTGELDTNGVGIYRFSGGETFVTNFVNAATRQVTQTGGDVYVGQLDLRAKRTKTVETATVTMNADSWKLSDGSLTANTIVNQGDFQMTGGTLRVGEFQGNLTNAGGTVEIASLAPITYTSEVREMIQNAIGTTRITGTYLQEAEGSLKIQIRDSENYDVLQASLFTLQGGDLWVEFLEEIPDEETSYNILQNLEGGLADVLGNFDQILWAGNPDQWSFADGILTFRTATGVPEPSTSFLLFVFGLFLLGSGKIRFRK